VVCPALTQPGYASGSRRALHPRAQQPRPFGSGSAISGDVGPIPFSRLELARRAHPPARVKEFGSSCAGRVEHHPAGPTSTKVSTIASRRVHTALADTRLTFAWQAPRLPCCGPARRSARLAAALLQSRAQTVPIACPDASGAEGQHTHGGGRLGRASPVFGRGSLCRRWLNSMLRELDDRTCDHDARWEFLADLGKPASAPEPAGDGNHPEHGKRDNDRCGVR
jgi:hypothetical protein